MKIILIVRLDNAETINISKSSQKMLLWAKQPSPPHPPTPKRKIFCQEIHCLPFYRLSQFAIWTVFALPFQIAFPCEKFPLQLWRYRCVTETWLPWAAAMWSSNGGNEVCSTFNFASASLLGKQGSKEENKIIGLAWISNAWEGYEFHW